MKKKLTAQESYDLKNGYIPFSYKSLTRKQKDAVIKAMKHPNWKG